MGDEAEIAFNQDIPGIFVTIFEQVEIALFFIGRERTGKGTRVCNMQDEINQIGSSEAKDGKKHRIAPRRQVSILSKYIQTGFQLR